jgi:hypothetical protein
MALFLLALSATVAITPIAAALASSSGSVLSVSQSDWQAFNASVSGRLHNGVPLLAPCYRTFNGKEQV